MAISSRVRCSGSVRCLLALVQDTFRILHKAGRSFTPNLARTRTYAPVSCVDESPAVLEQIQTELQVVHLTATPLLDKDQQSLEERFISPGDSVED